MNKLTEEQIKSKEIFDERISLYNIPKDDPFYMLMKMMQEIKMDIIELKNKKVVSSEEISEALSNGIGGKIEDRIVVALDGFQVNAETAPLDYEKISEFTSKVVAEHVHKALHEIFNEDEPEESEKTLLNLWGRIKKRKEKK